MDEQPQVVIHSKFKRCCMCGTDTLEHTARGDGQAVAEAAEKRPQGARWHKAIVYTFGQQIPKDV